MKNEFEKIRYNRVSGVKFLINDITYRRPHLHFDTEIAYVISGEGTVNTQEVEYLARVGQLIIFNSCQVHEFKSNSAMRLLIMQLPLTNFAINYPALDTMLFDSQPISLIDRPQLLSNLIAGATSYFDDTDEHSQLLTIGLAYQTLYEILKSARFDRLNHSQQNKLLDLQNRLQRISSTIQANFVDGISLQKLADQENFSRTYFSHFFRNNFGISFQKYLDNIRCERGRYLLLTTNENLLNITQLCGFSDARTFNQAFEKCYGCSPKNFRKERVRLQNSEVASVAKTVSIDSERIFNPEESLTVLAELSKDMIALAK